jgi:broad specificity phosphatase PhoE
LNTTDGKRVLWLLRHGNRQDFIDMDWGKTAARPHDPPLSSDGMDQALRAGERLGGEGIEHIFTSPYLRCAQTAELVARRIAAPVDVEPGLGELNHPDWTAGLPALLSLVELAAATAPFAGTHSQVHEPAYPETIEQAFIRAEKTARALTETYPGTLLLVSHAVAIIGIVRGLTGHSDDLHCPVASLFRLERMGAAWVLEMAGDTSHLDAAVAADRFH